MTDQDLGSYEMLWDCGLCGTTKLLGLSQRHCPNCGAPQDPNTRYFPSDADKVLAKDHVYVGADVRCGACDTPNSKNARFCVGCGAPLDRAKEVHGRRDQVVAEGQSFASDSAKAARLEQQASRDTATMPRPARPPRSRAPWLVLAALVAAAAVAMLLWKKQQTLIATAHHWSREIRIERFGPEAGSSWCDALPSDAYRTSRHREVRSHRQIADGESCELRRVDRQDGTFSERRECHPRYRDEPVYDDKCDYLVDRWSYARSQTTGGDGLAESPSWPALRLKTGLCVGCEREGGRNERYVVDFADAQTRRVKSCAFDQARWAQISEGSRWQAAVGAVTGHIDCDSLRAAP